MERKLNLLFTICARAGSKGFRNKNLKELNGVPLIYYTLAAVKAYQEAHPGHNITVALNTDSEPLKEAVRRQKAVEICYIPRKAGLAGDIVPKVEVIKDTFHSIDGRDKLDAVIDLDVTSPYRRVGDIENVLKTYTGNPGYDLVFSVVKSRRSPYFNMVEQKENGYFGKVCPAAFTARQQAPASYELNASIYAYRPQFLETDIIHTILDYHCGIAVMPDYLVLDIDSEQDFKMMEYLLPYYCKADGELKKIFESAGRLL